MKLDLTVSSSPHIVGRKTVSGIMLDVIIALLPAGFAGVFFFGIRAALVIGVSVISCVFFEWLWQKIMKQKSTIGDLSAVVTGLLLAYNLPPTLPLWMVAIGALFAMIVVKHFFGGIGNNFMNPALGGRAFLMAAWTVEMNKWFVPMTLGLDASSSATPLYAMKSGHLEQLPDLISVFWGNIGGCIGETSAAALIIGGIYLLARRVISWRIPVSFLGAVALMTFISGSSGGMSSALMQMTYHLLGGGLLLGAFFMATDYTTSPVSSTGQIMMGLGCGVITVVIRLAGGAPEGVSYAIMLMNIATPLIDRFTRPRVFGHGKPAKEA